MGIAATGTGATVTVKNDGIINVKDSSSVGMYADLGYIDNTNGTLNVTDEGIGTYIKGTATITNMGTINVTEGVAYVVEGITLGAAPTGNIILHNGTSGKYSIGGYYKNVNGTIVLPTVTQGNYTMNSAISEGTNNIATVISGTPGNTNQIGIYAEQSVTAVTNVDINGDQNIGIYGSQGDLMVNNITVGGITPSTASNNMNSSSVGAYMNNGNLTATTVDVRDNGIGVYGDNSNVTVGNLLIADKALGAYGSNGGTVTINTQANIGEGSLGVIGKNTNIISNAKIQVSKGTSVGLMSQGKGDITSTEEIKVDDKGSSTASIGIYKGTGRTIQKDGNKKIVLDSNGDEIELTKGIHTEGTITTAKTITVEDGGYGIYVDNKAKGFTTGQVTVNNGAGINLKEASVGIYAGGKVSVNNTGKIITGATWLGPNNDHNKKDEHQNSVGIYGEKGAILINDTVGIIESHKDHSLGIYVKDPGSIVTNNGRISVDNGGVGILAINHATVVNNGTIETGYGKGICGQENVAIGAYSGAIVRNSSSGTINVGEGTGVYLGDTTQLINDGAIYIDNGVGVKGSGKLVNNGTITVKDLNRDGKSIGSKEEKTKTDPLNHGAITISKDEDVLVNNQYVHSGSSIASNVVSNGAIVNIVDPNGDYMFNVNTIEGEITLDSNFIKTGNGYAWSVDNFLNTALLTGSGARELKVKPSPLFVAEITDKGSLEVAKQPYAYLVTGTQFDNLYNGIDSLLGIEQGKGKNFDLLAGLNDYLDKIYVKEGKEAFDAEIPRTLAEIRGDIYSTIHQRLEHVQGAFDSAYEELVNSHNFTKDTGKYSVIYQQGSYEDKTIGVDDYDYKVQGLNLSSTFITVIELWMIMIIKYKD